MDRKRIGQVRIIGGQWRGRKLPVIDSVGLRPTSDRVKETLFNWLAPAVAGAHCLDCFAGSGSLGFEAFSRYAARVIFLENDYHISNQLKSNIQQLNATHIEVIQEDALKWLSQQVKHPFDIIFLDPPFHTYLLEAAIQLLEKNHWLSPEAWIYVETEKLKNSVITPVSWQLHREMTTANVISRLYFRQG